MVDFISSHEFMQPNGGAARTRLQGGLIYGRPRAREIVNRMS